MKHLHRLLWLSASLVCLPALRINIVDLPPYMAPIVADRRVSITDVPAHNTYGYVHYQSEQVFLRSLVADRNTYEPDPEAADLFLVPMWSVMTTYHGGGAAVIVNMENRIMYLNSTEPHASRWARRGGTDHVFWAAGDQGACGLSAAHGSVIVSEFGDVRCTTVNSVVVPATLEESMDAEYTATLASLEERSTLFFFSGQVGTGAYSQGVRRAVFDTFNSTDGFRLVDSAVERMDMVSFMQSMRRSQFCLAPSGSGFGVRIVYAAVAGCIPVVIQDGVRQPFDDVMDYWDFSISLRFEDIPRLDNILGKVTPTKAQHMRRHLRGAAKNFLWRTREDGVGMAYETALRALQRRVYSISTRSVRIGCDQRMSP